MSAISLSGSPIPTTFRLASEAVSPVASPVLLKPAANHQESLRAISVQNLWHDLVIKEHAVPEIPREELKTAAEKLAHSSKHIDAVAKAAELVAVILSCRTPRETCNLLLAKLREAEPNRYDRIPLYTFIIKACEEKLAREAARMASVAKAPEHGR